MVNERCLSGDGARGCANLRKEVIKLLRILNWRITGAACANQGLWLRDVQVRPCTSEHARQRFSSGTRRRCIRRQPQHSFTETIIEACRSIELHRLIVTRCACHYYLYRMARMKYRGERVSGREQTILGSNTRKCG